jgi:hypothetical protein
LAKKKKENENAKSACVSRYYVTTMVIERLNGGNTRLIPYYRLSIWPIGAWFLIVAFLKSCGDACVQRGEIQGCRPFRNLG